MAQVWTTIWHYVFREQVRILCMTQRFGEFPFLEHSVTTWNRGNEWMRPRVSVHLVNVIKVYFLLLLKILIESCISFLHLPHWTIGPFHAARFGKYWSTQFLCLQGFGTCCSLLDHSALPTPSTDNCYFSFKFYLQYYFLMETFPDLHCPLTWSHVSVLSFHGILLPSLQGPFIAHSYRFTYVIFFYTYVIQNGLSAV